MYQTLLTSLDNGIFTVTINRPDKLNALNRDVMNDLLTVFSDEIPNNEAIKAVILTGSGSKSFVAGADISEFIGLNSGEGMDLARKGQDIFFRIENCTKPVVAAVNGFALRRRL
jgi:enoyl-CoA hydratase